MNAVSFDDLVTQILLSGFKHRMLYVFVRVSAMGDETRREMSVEDADVSFVQILFDAHQAVEPGLKFDQVRETADAHETDWTLCVVGLAKNSNATLPSEEQAQAFLTDMREKILAGDVEQYAIIDRDGKSVSVVAEEVNDTPRCLN